MSYVEAILILFAIVDPIGSIPIFLDVAKQAPEEHRRKTLAAAVIVSVLILLIITFAGNAILKYVFHINLADLRLAGGLLLLVMAVNSLINSSPSKSDALKQKQSKTEAYELGCVPLACPLLAGPGAMVTSLAIHKSAGPVKAVVAIAVVFWIVAMLMFFIDYVHKFIGATITTIFGKVMQLFIAAIGANMIMTGLQYYFPPVK